MTADAKKLTRMERLEQTTKDQPESSEAFLRYGSALIKAGRAKDARLALERAVALDPGNAKAWVNLGGLSLANFDFQSCVDQNQKAVEVSPDLLEAHYNLGLGYLYLGDGEAMTRCFRKVVELEPMHPGGNYHLAVGLLAIGEKIAARDALKRALDLGYSPQPEFVRKIERQSGGLI